MIKKDGGKPNEVNPLDNLGENKPTDNPTNPVVDLQTKKLLELVEKLSKQVEDQEQKLKDLKDLKAVAPGFDGMAELIKEVRKGNVADMDAKNPLRYYKPEEIDLEDVLKEPVVFYAYGTGYVIADDKRNGKPQLTPFGNSLFFTHQATQKVKDGKHTHLHSYSTFPSYSKKEAEWLREHSRFGIHFFETAKEAIETNSDIAARISKHLNSVSALDPGQIVNIYRSKGLPNTTDIGKMKSSLALEYVKEEIQNDVTNQQKYFRDIFDTNVQLKEKIGQ